MACEMRLPPRARQVVGKAPWIFVVCGLHVGVRLVFYVKAPFFLAFEGRRLLSP
jgi:hypothetical protein